MPRKKTKQTKSEIKVPIEIASEQDLAQPITPRVLNEYVNILGTTDTSVSGTLSAAGNLVNKLENLHLKVLNYQLLADDIDQLKSSLSQLEDLRLPIQKIEEFMKNNLEFIMVATESKGRLNVFENHLASIEKRVAGLEEKNYKTKDRTIAIWAVIIAVLSLIATVIIAFMK